MANGTKIYDPVTTQTMLSAFDTAQAECSSIQNGVDGAASRLAGTWRGGASQAYNRSMQSWLEGFQQVQQALNSLNESMNYYRSLLTQVESGNQQTGGGWSLASRVAGPMTGTTPGFAPTSPGLAPVPPR